MLTVDCKDDNVMFLRNVRLLQTIRTWEYKRASSSLQSEPEIQYVLPPESLDLWILHIVPNYEELENTTYGKLDLFQISETLCILVT